MIITGGEHVYPSEVEEIISAHEDIFDVAVIGIGEDNSNARVDAAVQQALTHPLLDVDYRGATGALVQPAGRRAPRPCSSLLQQGGGSDLVRQPGANDLQPGAQPDRGWGQCVRAHGDGLELC